MKEKNTKQGGLAYFIIGLILVLVFIIGALMWGETERAEAAISNRTQTVDVNIAGANITFDIWDVRELDWEPWLSGSVGNVYTDCTGYSEPNILPSRIVDSMKYMSVVCSDSTRNGNVQVVSYLFTNDLYEFGYNSDNYLWANVEYASCYIVIVDYSYEIPRVIGVQGMADRDYGNGSLYLYNGYYGNFVLGSTFDFLDGWTNGVHLNNIPRNNLICPKDMRETIYSTDAPYISFNRLSVKNLIADGETRKSGIFSDMYEDYTKASTWAYHGKLNNRDMTDIEYLLEVDFAVEIPLISYVEELAYMMDVNLEQEHSVLSNLPDMVTYWNTDNGAEKYTYEFTYTFPITPDFDGNFSYQLSFDTIETLVMYFNEDARERINEYSDYWRSILLSFLHVDCTTAVVKTTREDCIVYGKICTNQFDRGVHDICIEVIPEIDINTATPEEIDKILTDALEDAHDKYLTELENRLEELENQLNASTSLVEGENLWNAFKTTVSGVLGMLSTVLVIPQALGSIFTFFPQEMQDFMGYVLIVCFVVIVWKALKK